MSAIIQITPEQFTALVERKKFALKINRTAVRQLDAEEVGLDAIPEGITLQALLAEPDEAQAWIIQDLLPAGGRALFSAQYKSGKTTVVTNLVRCLVGGGDFLGRFPVTPPDGIVAVLDFEMPRQTLRKWYRDQGIGRSENVELHFLRGKAASFDIRLAEVRQRWITKLRSSNVRFLVVDCLRPILDALGLDEHKDCGLFLTALDVLLRDAGIAGALVVHHAGHTGERARGDSRLRDWPDAEWVMVRATENPASQRFFTAIGRDVEVPESALSFDEVTRKLTMHPGRSRSKGKLRAALTAIQGFLRSNEGATKKGLEEHLGGEHAQQTIRSAITWGVKTDRLAYGAAVRGRRLVILGTNQTELDDEEAFASFVSPTVQGVH